MITRVSMGRSVTLQGPRMQATPQHCRLGNVSSGVIFFIFTDFEDLIILSRRKEDFQGKCKMLTVVIFFNLKVIR